MTPKLELDHDVPRRNGELVFDQPWQSRAFGMALAMIGHGSYEWGEFRRLVDAQVDAGEGMYYERWLLAFERLVLDRELVSQSELDVRAAEFAAMQREEVF